MRDRSFPEPTEYVIWGASGLLALLLGLGSAFFLWVVLRHSEHPGLAAAAVYSLAAGVILIGVALERPLIRIFLILFAVALVASYAAGAPEFARLVP